MIGATHTLGLVAHAGAVSTAPMADYFAGIIDKTLHVLLPFRHSSCCR